MISFKSLVKPTICLAICLTFAGCGDSSDGGTEKPAAQNTQTQESNVTEKNSPNTERPPQSTNAANVNWKTDFEDPMSIAHNMDLCKKVMLQMDSVAANAQKVSPADVLRYPANYFGKVLEIGATVAEAEDFPPNSGGAKFFDGVGHVIVAQADDGTIIMASKKGAANEQAGQFKVLVGMLAGIQDLPNEKTGKTEKALFIVGDPSASKDSVQNNSQRQNNSPQNVSSSPAPTGEHWIRDEETYVYLWNPKPQEGETVSWQGDFVEDGGYKYAEGFGKTTWYRHGEMTQQDEGTFEHGRRHGVFKHKFFPSGNVDYSTWEHGVRQ